MLKLRLSTPLSDINSQPSAATGVLLIGGHSRRMGKDKLGLMLNGQTLADRGIAVLHTCFKEVLISMRPGQADIFQLSEKLIGRPTLIEDPIPNKGPLGALYAALQASAHDWVFLAACDMPCFSPDSIRELAQFLPRTHDKNPPQADEKPRPQLIVARAHGIYQMLHGFYHRSLLPIVQEHLIHNRLKLSDLIPEGHAHIVDWRTDEACFKNINTPQEWEEFLAKAKE